MLTFASVTICALLSGRVTNDEAAPLAPRASCAEACVPFDPGSVIVVNNLEGRASKGSMPSHKFHESSHEHAICESEDSGDEDVQSLSPADPPWLRPTESRVTPHF